MSVTVLWVIAATAASGIGQVDVREDLANRPPTRREERRAVLQQALADYEAALATQDQAGPKAQHLYSKALNGFDALLRGGIRSGDLHYNIANTYLRLGQVGKAVVHYRRGLRLLPGNGRILKNLESARNLCRVRIRPKATSAFVRTLFFWHFGTSSAARADVALLGYALFWLLMGVRLFALRRTPAFPWIIRAVAAVTLIVAASLAWEGFVRGHRAEGVIISDSVILRKGNGTYYDAKFEQPLSEGVEFRAIEERDDVEGTRWRRVELRDGQDGWLPADQAEMI